MAAHRGLIKAVRDGLAAVADPEKAPGMQAYMKSVMPYYGVQSTPLRQVCKEVFTEYPLADRPQWTETALSLWRKAKFREERYAARELTGWRLYASWQDVHALPMYLEMVSTGAWWDHVDEVAIRRIGPIHRAYRETVTPMVRRWSTDDDMWIRRTSIICQIGAKASTDYDLLAEVIEPSVESREFFLPKAIGWALRDLAWHDPDWVVSYVDSMGDRLSGLSRREALKNVDR
ncbi:DNA alkylation repair protein [Fodinicola feengrottensis]|uniref:DNA alkylation repair protein n=2 Tax=Fodinicola feengrottensis TaxID=435914 RepID=A0ABP4SVW1_9ACTN